MVYLGLQLYVTSSLILKIQAISFLSFPGFMFTQRGGIRWLQLLLLTVQFSVRPRQTGKPEQIFSFSIASVLKDHLFRISGGGSQEKDGE